MTETKDKLDDFRAPAMHSRKQPGRISLTPKLSADYRLMAFDPGDPPSSE
jgi:hypothetical protein